MRSSRLRLKDDEFLLRVFKMYEIPTNLEEEILRLKKEKNAVILAHFYQDSEIQDIADFVGDSLDLSRNAASTNADEIIFCGVKFMAEVAKILSPQKKVWIPDLKAGCSLEDSCKPDVFGEFCRKNPDHIVVSYINCSAEIKALSNIIVTSTNAKKIIDQLPANQKIIFAPDQHLGRYINKITGRNMLLWNGSCMVHEQYSERELVKLIANYPNAKVIAHPECPETLLSYAHHIGSTSSLLKYVSDTQGGEFIVLTEVGILHQMRQKNPTAKLYDCPFVDAAGCTLCNSCPYMKLNTLEKLYLVMKYGSDSIYGGELNLSEELRIKAEKPLRKMLEMSEDKKEDDQKFIKKGEEQKESEPKDIVEVEEGQEVSGVIGELKNLVFPNNNQQRNLSRETGGLEAEEDNGISAKDAWDARSEEVDKMGSNTAKVFNSTGMKSLVWKQKKARLDNKELAKEAIEAAAAIKGSKKGAAKEVAPQGLGSFGMGQQGGFVSKLQNVKKDYGFNNDKDGGMGR